MSKYCIIKPFWSKKRKFKFLFDILGESKLKLVGGAVRSAINFENCLDIDLAVSIEPKDVKKILVKNNITFYDYSDGHGTITLILNNYKIEITSLRIDKINLGRKAIVEFTKDFFLDSCRRDFTINSIYSSFKGEIYDPHNGVEDLKKKIIRYIGVPEKRIIEDNLRILRYFRFIAIYNSNEGQLDKGSLLASVSNAKLLKNVSKERINKEFIKLISASNAGFVLSLMKKYKILNIIAKGLEKISYLNLKKIDQIAFDEISRISYLHLKSKIELKQDLKISRKNINLIEKICNKFIPIKEISEAKKIKYKCGEEVTKKIYFLYTAINEIKPKNSIIKIIKFWDPPVFPINGHDVKSFKSADGKRVGIFYKEIENWWVERDFKPNRRQCLLKLKKINI